MFWPIWHFECVMFKMLFYLLVAVFFLFLAQLDVQTLHVHLPNHGFRTIRFDEASDVRQVINLIVGSMSPGQSPNPQSYALRLRHILTREVCIKRLTLQFYFETFLFIFQTVF